MTNVLDTSSLSDAVSSIDLPSIDIDLPGLSDVGDALSDASDAIAASAAVAGRRTSRLARRTARVSARGGSAGARLAWAGTRATGRVVRRGSVGSVRIARRHPRISAGVLAAVIALLVGYVVARRSSASGSDADLHLAAVA